MTSKSPSPSRRPRERADAFCNACGLRFPMLMAGAYPAALAAAVANAGGMGAMGAFVSKPDAIRAWVNEFRSAGGGQFQLSTWIPDPPPHRDREAEARVRFFLAA